ncbi:MAG: TerD family protein [Victivallaceae bacterium]
MVFDMQKGQAVAINQMRLIVGLGWDPGESGTQCDLDASACLLNSDWKIFDELGVVYYNNPASRDGAVRACPDDRRGEVSNGGDNEQILVDLSRISPDVEAVVFAASIYEAMERNQNFGDIKNSYVRIIDADCNQEICRYVLDEDFSFENAIEFGQLCRCDSTWAFYATGVGFAEGLQGVVDNYS